jgi:hypothetical protein
MGERGDAVAPPAGSGAERTMYNTAAARTKKTTSRKVVL